MPSTRTVSRLPRPVAAGAIATVILVALIVLLLSSGRGHDSRRPAADQPSSRPFEPSASGPPPALRAGAVAVARGAVAYRAAADTNHVVWETGPVEEEGVRTALHQRDLGSGRRTTLARDVFPAYGLGSTARWIAYAEGFGGRRLVAETHDGSRRVLLSKSLVAPIAARGELIAWAEEGRGAQRVIVRDMARGVSWVAVRMPRCEGERCYQIGAVGLADRGVVFTRNTSAPDVSLLVRRAFSDARPSQVEIPHDPQPDLLPSSAGALYYELGRGWYRWDFGRASPRKTGFAANPPAQLLAYERGRWFMVRRRGCASEVVSVSGNGRRTVVAAPEAVRARVAAADHESCVELGSLVWTGRQALTAWGVVPDESEEEHSDAGIGGVVHAGRAHR